MLLYLTMQYIYSQGGGLCLLYLTMQYIYYQGRGWCSLYLTMQYIYSQGGGWSYYIYLCKTYIVKEEAGAHYI